MEGRVFVTREGRVEPVVRSDHRRATHRPAAPDVTMRGLLTALVVLLAACGPAPSGAPPGTIASLAGPGAVDCGSGQTLGSDGIVRRCVDEQRRLGRACFFVTHSSAVADDRVAYGSGVMPGDPVVLGYVVEPDGALREVWQLDGKEPSLRSGAIRIGPSGARLGPGFRPPVPTSFASRPVPARSAERLLVETIVRSNGTVASARALRAPDEYARETEALVRQTRFEPALMMGVPFEIVWNVAIDARDGSMQIQAPRTERARVRADTESAAR